MLKRESGSVTLTSDVHPANAFSSILIIPSLITTEEEVSILTLTDENGADIDFEYLDCIEYQDKEYLVLMPVAEEESNEIVILEVEPVDEENENYLAVSDEDVLEAVYAIFKDRFKDILTFED